MPARCATLHGAAPKRGADTLSTARSYQKPLLRALFRAAFESLSALCWDPKHLGGRIGALAVLHTWSRTLDWHPHIPMLVPGGALDADVHVAPPVSRSGCALCGKSQPPEADDTARLTSALCLNSRADRHHESALLMIVAVSSCSKSASQQAVALTSAYQKRGELPDGP